jgi:metallo-beta-lactamase family protein
VKLLSAGAALTVTGSCHRIEARGRRILVDCGLFQGGQLERLNAEPFPFGPPGSSRPPHGHLDHCGRLAPRRSRFCGPSRDPVTKAI